MATLCFNSTRFVRGWFDALARVQDRMAMISHETATNTREFSKQKMGALLRPGEPGFDLRAANLKQFCQQSLGLLVPDDAIQADRDFLSFVGRISVPADKRLVRLFICVAEKFGPAGIPLADEAKFAALTLAGAYHDRPFDENTGFRTLDELLRESLNPAFFRGPTLFGDRKKTVADAIRTILT